jgi:hypothetical protein
MEVVVSPKDLYIVPNTDPFLSVVANAFSGRQSPKAAIPIG